MSKPDIFLPKPGLRHRPEIRPIDPRRRPRRAFLPSARMEISQPFMVRPKLVTNRLRAILIHLPYYCTAPKALLAADTGISQNAVSRIVRGRLKPSRITAELICRAINRHSPRRLSLHEVFSVDGSYPTASACELMGCKGCFPPEAWDEHSGQLRPEWQHQKPGEWSRREADPLSPGHLI